MLLERLADVKRVAEHGQRSVAGLGVVVSTVEALLFRNLENVG